MQDERAPSGLYDRILDLTGSFVGLMIALMALLISVEVAMRNMGMGGISWLNEAIEFALYGGTFAAAPWALHKGAHIRVDIVVTMLPRLAALAVEIIADLLGAAICFAMFYYGVQAVIDAWVDNTIQYKNLAWPEWALFAIVPVFTILMAVEFLARALRAVKSRGALPAEAATTEGF